MATRKVSATKEKAPSSKAKVKKPEAKAEVAVAKAPKESIEYGSAWLVEYVNEQAGTNYSATALRILLRKLTKDGVLEREADGRARYNFPKGEKDPQVKAIVKAVKDGGADKARQERLDDLKANKKSKKAAPAAPAKKSRKAKAVEEVEEDDDLDVDDI